jgi:hypothetical protein
MSSKSAASTRKREQTAEVPEAVVSSDDQSKSKARRVSTDAQERTVVSQETTEEVTTANANSASTTIATQEDDSMESIGLLIQDLFHSDNAKVNATLDTLSVGLAKDRKKQDKIQSVGGFFALVHLVKDCLKETMDKFPACDQDIELIEAAELYKLYKTLSWSRRK